MFDADVATPGEGLVAAIEQAAREENKASARRYAAIAEFVHRTVDEDDERGGWAFDPWKNAAAQVGAALSVGQRRTSGQMRIAVALRDRLPRVAALFMAGSLSARLISEITWRTHLVEDDFVIAVIDGALAERAAKRGPLSDAKLAGAIEAVIERYDPDAVRRAREVIATRGFRIGACDDPNELVSVWGKLTAGDGEAFEAPIAALVKGLCEDDPRTAGERRSDAAGAIVHDIERLACRCGSPECPAPDPVSSRVVIQVIADQDGVDAAHDLIAAQDREQQQKRAENKEPAEEPERPRKKSGVAVRPKGWVLPIPALAEAIRGGAAFVRARARVESELQVPKSPLGQDVLGRLRRCAATQRGGHLDHSGRSYAFNDAGESAVLPGLGHHDREAWPLPQPLPGLLRTGKMPRRRRTRAGPGPKPEPDYGADPPPF